MTTRDPVYKEWDRILVPAPGHGPGAHYRVFHGTVDWNGKGDLKRAIVIFMQYGDEADWEKAKRSDQIAWGIPAHVLDEDVLPVLAAIEKLKR